MTAPIAIALCGIAPVAARRVADWLDQHAGLQLRVAYSVDSLDRLLARLAAEPVHGVVLDGSLGLEGISFARDLMAAGYRAVCLAGTADRPHVRQRAGDLGLAACPDYEPARLAALLRQLLGLSATRAAEGRVIAFHSPRGGAGTTTLLLQVARLLHTHGRHVAIVETGGGAGVVPLLGLRSGGGWDHLLPSLHPDLAGDPGGPDLVARALTEISPGLHLLASGGPAVMDQVGPDEVEAVIHLLPACGIEYVLCDTASELTLPTATALTLAHAICLVALPDPVTAFRLVQTHEVLSGLHVNTDRIHPVINRVREGVSQRLQEVLEFLRYRPPLRVPEESKGPVDSGGRFIGFRPGSGAAKAVESLQERLALDATPTAEVRIP